MLINKSQKTQKPFIIYNTTAFVFEDRLSDANPWWSSPDAINDDSAIVKMERSPLKRAVGERHRLEARDRTYLLCGPRRVGKTTLLKMEIRRLLGEGVPPDRLLYFSFDSDVRPADIYAIVDEYFAMHRGAGRRFLLFDEVTSVKNWHKAVKNMLDGGKLRGCTLAVTGSQATGVVGPVGHLAGRGDRPMDDTLEAVLDPMSFGEYASLRDPEIRAELRRLSLDSGRARLDAVRRMTDGELPDPVRGLLASTTALNVHFRSYLLAGGMPAVANHLAAENTIPDETFDYHEAALRTDAMGAGLRYGTVARMLPPVARSVGSPVSWSSLRDAATIESHRLMEDYAGALSDMFLLRVIYRYDPSGDAPKTNVPKKVYFRDPFPFNVAATSGMRDRFARAAGAVDDAQTAGRAAEQAVAGHVARLASAMDSRADPLGHRDNVFYWKSRRGREVDFVMRAAGGGRGGRLVPIEVKWQSRVRRDDMYGIFDFRKAVAPGAGGMVLSKSEAREQSGLTIVPAAIFALLAA